MNDKEITIAKKEATPITSIITWTQYNGKNETLPIVEQEVIIYSQGDMFYGYLEKPPNPHFIKNPLPTWGYDDSSFGNVQVNDLWAYLPDPPDIKGK